MGTLRQAIAILATDGVEQIELTEPRKARPEAGAEVELISLEKGKIQSFNHLDKADTFRPTRPWPTPTRTDYDGLVLPGGVANPDTLRIDEDAIAFVQAFFDAGKPVAAICHAPWMLVEADVVKGRTHDLVAVAADRHPQRGRQWVDEEVVVDQGLVTSRKPDDLGVQRQDGRGVRRGRARGAPHRRDRPRRRRQPQSPVRAADPRGPHRANWSHGSLDLDRRDPSAWSPCP